MNIAQLKTARLNHLNLTDCEALITIATLGSVEMSKLAKSLGITSAGITSVADRLIKLALIERQYCTTDRRVITLQATHKGHALVTRLGVKAPAPALGLRYTR